MGAFAMPSKGLMKTVRIEGTCEAQPENDNHNDILETRFTIMPTHTGVLQTRSLELARRNRPYDQQDTFAIGHVRVTRASQPALRPEAGWKIIPIARGSQARRNGLKRNAAFTE